MLAKPIVEPFQPKSKDQLRFITCGSVDDGKSTLIGRLLHDSKLIYEDQWTALERDSAKHGTSGRDVDFALLVDGLEAEREQGITIDVAHRFFATERRSFMVADTPGHEQYTRNMATGASNAQLAVILIDARKGVLVQTKRHSFICSLLGIRHLVLAVNKIDLVSYKKEIFDRIFADYVAFAADLGFASIVPIPISARYGDNVVDRSCNTQWHDGPCLLGHLESIDIGSDSAGQAFRFPVQWVNRPNMDFRGYAGSVASGSISVGDDIVVATSGRIARIKRIVTRDGDLACAESGDAITIALEDEIDVRRGDLLARPTERPQVADKFAAHLIWMDEDPLIVGRNYILRIGTQTTAAYITAIKHEIDVNTREHQAARTLSLNEIGFCNVSTALPAAFDPYEVNRKTGSFILIDRYTNRTVAAGMIASPLRRAANVAWQPLDVGRKERGRPQEPEALHYLVHRPVRRGKVDDCQYRRSEVVCNVAACHLAGWGQRPARTKCGPRFLRCRPRGEHSACRRSCQVDGGQRLDRDLLVYLALQGGSRPGAQLGRWGGVHRSLCRHADRRMHAARSQRSLFKSEVR